MLHPISFIYIQTTFKHQLQDMYASQKIQTFPGLRSPETHFRLR